MTMCECMSAHSGCIIYTDMRSYMCIVKSCKVGELGIVRGGGQIYIYRGGVGAKNDYIYIVRIIHVWYNLQVPNVGMCIVC